jgi:hypothetical protein
MMGIEVEGFHRSEEGGDETGREGR